MNNNLKIKLINFAMSNVNFYSVKQLSTHNLDTCKFKITIITNKEIKHVLTFDYHLKLISYKLKGNISNLSKESSYHTYDVIDKAKEIRRTIIN